MKRMKFFCFVCGILLALLAMSMIFSALTPSQAVAQGMDLMSVTVEGTSKAATPTEASHEITAWATTNTARQEAINILGDARYQKSKAAVENKVVKQSSRFMPYVNPGEPQKQPDGSWKMPVELKISTSSLRQLILEAGLLSDAEGPASLAPLIAFTDRTKSLTAHWWLGEEKDEAHQPLNQLSHLLHERMQSEFIKQGFYMMNPIGLQVSPLPAALKSERPSAREIQAIAEHFKVSMIAKGDVRVSPSRAAPGAYDVTAKIQVVQPATGRAVAEVSRQFTTDVSTNEASALRAKASKEFPELAKDLSAQVLDAWQRGTLNANLVNLAVEGPLNPKQLGAFKMELLKNVREVKSLKERLFDRGSVTFEADVTGDESQLAEHLKALKVPGFHTRLAEASGKNLTLEVQAQ